MNRRVRAARGFTLIEIAVVVVIIGIMATFAVLSIGDRSSADQLNAEAQSTAQLIQLASDEAGLKSLQIGMLYSVVGYQFVVIDRHRRWATYDPSGTLRPRPWPGGITAQLSVEGHPVALAADPSKAKKSNAASASSAGTGAANGSSAKPGDSSSDSDSDSAADAKEKDPLKPQVLLLSSGEMTAFTLDLKSSNLKFFYRLESDETGHLKSQRLSTDAKLSADGKK